MQPDVGQNMAVEQNMEMVSRYPEVLSMNPARLMATLVFSEATKNKKNIEQDATGVANVVKNRLARPERFGTSLPEVILSPHQFSGVGTPEWDKAYYQKFTDDEEKIFKRYLQISNGVITGKIKDNTGGADHYYNPKLAAPSWADVYEKTYSSDAHDYHAELKEKKSKQTKLTFNEAFKRANQSGKKKFNWNGKSYKVEFADK